MPGGEFVKVIFEVAVPVAVRIAVGVGESAAHLTFERPWCGSWLMPY